MANGYLDDAPYSVAMRYPNELFLEDRHAEKATCDHHGHEGHGEHDCGHGGCHN